MTNNEQIMKQFLLTTITVILCAITLIFLAAQPVNAQDSKVNYTYSQLHDVDLSGKDLKNGVFAAADVRNSTFAGSDLSKTILTKAAFLNTNLSGVNLTDSLMDRVAFENCDLSNAVLQDIVATSTSFANTNITGADFSGAILDRYQTYLLCQRAEGTNPTTGIDTRDSLLCR
jgi:uncharacterized protein YjbI with pentapeptide repeats